MEGMLRSNSLICGTWDNRRWCRRAILIPMCGPGVRAQIQHLKAYATADPLAQECVDDRYEYVQKGSAPYVQWLGQKENPQGAGWATAENYGYSIVEMISHLKGKNS